MCRYTISAETLRAAQALRVLKQATSVETGLRKLYTGGTASSSSQQYPTQLWAGFRFRGPVAPGKPPKLTSSLAEFRRQLF
jgi:hypothetical protein